MSLPVKEPLVGHIQKVSVECSDCGRRRWWRPADLAAKGVPPRTPLSRFKAKLTCSACREDGLPGKTLSVSAEFVTELQRELANAYLVNSREVLSEGSRAICA